MESYISTENFNAMVDNIVLATNKTKEEVTLETKKILRKKGISIGESLEDTIRTAQRTAGENAVIEDLRRKRLIT